MEEQMKLRMPIQIFLLACLWLAPALVRAQSPTTGQVAGVVKDASGAVISGARVTATNEAGVERSATTDENGRYAVPLLPPGAYRVEADKESFSKATAENVVVRITETTVLDIRLEVASQKASIIVTSEPPMVQTDTASRGDVISSETLTELPLPTRNFQQLLTLTPGTSSAISNSSDLGRGDTAFNVDGQRAVSNFIEINGIDANSIGTGSTPNLAVPATDTLQECIVQTSQYDASQGRNAGGIEAAEKKSGTDQFHGNI